MKYARPLLSSFVAVPSNSRGNNRVYFYENVVVFNVDKATDGVGYSIHFDVLGDNRRGIDWSRSSRFMNGSLLCLSSDGTFNKTSIVLATVLECVKQPQTGAKSGWRPSIQINIAKHSLSRFNPTISYVMIESMVYFESHRPTLDALKSLGREGSLPFESNLLGKSNKVLPPDYLINQKIESATTKKSAYSLACNYDSDDSSEVDINRPRGWNLSPISPTFQRVNGSKYDHHTYICAYMLD